jgi:hypothetical protein
MSVRMVHVGGVIVLVLDVIVTVDVGVLPDERWIVCMGMVAVIVTMHVLVLDRLVNMAMSMPLAGV